MRIFAAIGAGLIGAAILYCPVTAQAKTAKECRAEWQAHKADNQAKKITESAYVKECTAAAATEPAKSTQKPTSTPTATTKPEPKKTPASVKKPKSDAKGEYQFTTEAQAKTRCGSGTVVWANLSSKIFHFAGHGDYGKTKNGAYMCERDATGEGMRAAKNEKHP